jgi:hypothetical protein
MRTVSQARHLAQGYTFGGHREDSACGEIRGDAHDIAERNATRLKCLGHRMFHNGAPVFRGLEGPAGAEGTAVREGGIHNAARIGMHRTGDLRAVVNVHDDSTTRERAEIDSDGNTPHRPAPYPLTSTNVSDNIRDDRASNPQMSTVLPVEVRPSEPWLPQA